MVQPAIHIANDLLHLPFLHHLADQRGGDDLPVQRDGRDHIAGNAPLVAEAGKVAAAALAFSAEGEVIADDKADHIQLSDDGFGKLLPGHVHQPPGKVEKHHIVNAEAAADNLFPAPGIVDERHRAVEDQIIRMHVKAQHGGDRTQFRRTLYGFIQQGSMAHMHPVEEAHGQHPFDCRHYCTSKKLFSVQRTPFLNSPTRRNSPEGA